MRRVTGGVGVDSLDSEVLRTQCSILASMSLESWAVLGTEKVPRIMSCMGK